MDEHHKYTINKQLWVVFIFCIYGSEYTYAQWTKKDSLWLEKVISGKEKLQLNTETQKAIESGNFINFDKPADQMRLSTTPMIITKDFSEYLQIDDTLKIHRRVALKDLPPSVFMRYGLDKPLPMPLMIMGRRITELDPDIIPYANRPTGIDFNTLLSAAFSKQYRQIEYNKKHANAWKSYNSLPTREQHNKQRKYRSEHPEAVLPLPHVATRRDTTKIKPLAIDSLAKDSLAMGTLKLPTDTLMLPE